MNPTRVAAVALRQFYLIRGSFTRLLPLFVWAGIDMVLWGFITKYLNGVTGLGYFVPAMLGAVLLWDFCTRVMQGVTMAFLEDVWSRNLLNVFASPIRIPEYVTGLVLSSIATSSIGLTVMLILAVGVFGLSFFVYGVMLVPFFFTLFLFGIALGIAATAMVLRLGPASEWFVWPIPAFLAPFAGVFYPISVLPAWMRAISRVIPASYVFEGMRGVLQSKTISGPLLGLGLALAAFEILLACWFFVLMYNNAVKTGLIARYSAESVS